MKKLAAFSILLIFICMSLPSSYSIQIEHSSITLFYDGNTLYVGGNGSGNYSKIQDAIDNASDGDTVFVYDDSSPYVEELIINTSISLIGEDKNTTIIDGNQNHNIIIINDDNITISRFSIINFIYAYSVKNIKIIDNYILNELFGIDFHYVENSYIISNTFREFITAIICDHSEVTISDNLIISSTETWYAWSDMYCSGSNYVITNNTLVCEYPEDRSGLELEGVSDSIIEGNKFSGYDIDAIRLYSVENSIITHNNFNNSGGILIEGMSHSNKIINNNFIKNKRDAIERLLCFNNLWDGNYWDKWIGFKYKLPIFQRFPHIILFAIDWHPALEPYDI